MPDHPEPAAPRDISADEHQQRAEEAFALDQSIKDDLRTGRATLWSLAGKLYQFDEVTGWSALGYERQGEWLADPEVGMTRATFMRLVGLYRELVVRRQLPAARLADLDTSKVQIILPKLKTGAVKLEDALEDVKELGQRDLREKYMAPREPDVTDVEDGPDPDNDGDPGLIDETVDVARDAPENDGEDTPTWASDADDPEPAQNDDYVPSGQLQRDEGDGPTVITATAPHPNLGGLKVAVHAAEVALRLPDRQAVDRRAKRDALANLVAVVKLIDGWWEV